MLFPSKRFTLLAAAMLCTIPANAKTRWSANRTIPDADFIGSGELLVGYNGFINTDSTNKINLVSQVPVSIGVGNWLTVSTGWSNGVTAGFKARILDEFTPAMPSLAIGVRNLYHNTTVSQSGLTSDNPEFTGEIFLAASKGFDLITTRFHGGILSIPKSSTEQLNGFFGIEKYFGGSFYSTFEGISFYDRLIISISGTLRFAKDNRAEFYIAMNDLERLLFNQNYDLDMSLEPNFAKDLVKPGISAGITIDFRLPFGKQTQFRTIEDLYQEQNKELGDLQSAHNDLVAQLETERFRIDAARTDINWLNNEMVKPEILPNHYEEIYARMIAYRTKYDQKPFDPEGLRKIQDQIFAFGEDAEATLTRIIKKGDQNNDIERDAVSFLGQMKSQSAVPLLLDRLGAEKDRQMKIALISALGSIGDKNASYAIEHLALSNDKAVSFAAKEVLMSWKIQIPEIESKESDSTEEIKEIKEIKETKETKGSKESSSHKEKDSKKKTETKPETHK